VVVVIVVIIDDFLTQHSSQFYGVVEKIRRIRALEVSSIIKLRQLDVSYNRLTDNAFIAAVVVVVIVHVLY